MTESIHEKLKRVRKPHVHITYEVDKGDARVVKELPFVVGVMGDFSGDPTKELKPLRDRKFVQIDRDNFNAVMARMTPGLKGLKVDNKLKDGEPQMVVNLEFNSIEDFEPAQVVNQVDSLKELREARDKLRDMMAKADSSVELEESIERWFKENEKALGRLGGELGAEPGKEESK